MSCSFSSSDSTCGPTAYAPEDASIIPLRACRKDLSGYLTSLGVSGCRGIGTSNILAEYELILNRAGFYNLSREGGYGKNDDLSKAQIRAFYTFPAASTKMLVSNSQRRKEIPEKPSSGKQEGLRRNVQPISCESSNWFRYV